MTGAASPQVSIVVPVYNEESTVDGVLRELMALAIDKEVIVVDDGSTDATGAAIASVGPTLVHERLSVNRGKGAALRHGFAVARGRVVVIQDADLELSPALVEHLVAPILAGEADAVFGSRFLEQASKVRWSRRLANYLLTALCNLLYGTRLTDMATGHKAVRADLLQSLDLRAERFEIDAELAAKLARLGVRVQEVPSPYSPRTKDEGKKIRFTDGISAVRTLLRYARWRLPGDAGGAP